jgi:2-polyprenyl-3-methyl-5-hydroxy-6-metoxy-1,4-benzoquinol methylase
LFRTFPPEATIFKESAGRPSTEYDDEVSYPFYKWYWTDPTMFAGKDVLDLGSGFGGRPVRFAEYGAKNVTGIEVSEDHVRTSALFAEERGKANVRFVHGTGERIPLPDQAFDLITCYDVMEHVVSPAEVIRECWRVLRPGGRFAVVFPPYYHVLAGSHLHGYATRFPALNLLFTTKALKSAVRLLLEEQGVDYRRYLREIPTDKLWNQNGLTVRGFDEFVKASPFRVESIEHVGQPSRHFGFVPTPPMRGPLQSAVELAANTPILQEALCSRVVAMLIRDR